MKRIRLFYYLTLIEVCSVVSNFQFYPHGRNFLILYSIIFSFWKRWLPLFSSWSTWKSLIAWGSSNLWVFIFSPYFLTTCEINQGNTVVTFTRHGYSSCLTRVPWKLSNLSWNASALSEEKAMKLKTWSHPQQFLDEILTVLLPSFFTKEMMWRRNLCSLSYLVVLSVFLLFLPFWLEKVIKEGKMEYLPNVLWFSVSLGYPPPPPSLYVKCLKFSCRQYSGNFSANFRTQHMRCLFMAEELTYMN